MSPRTLTLIFCTVLLCNSSVFSQSVDSEARSLYREGHALARQPEEAKRRLGLEKLQQSARLFQQIEAREPELLATFSAAFLAEQLTEYSLARDLYLRSLPMFERPPYKKDLPDIFYSIGRCSMFSGDRTMAIDYFLRAGEIWGQGGEIAKQAMMENDVGALYYQLGNYDLALQYLVPALEKRRKLDNRCELAATLTNIGAVRLAQRRWTMAIDVLQKQALPLYKTEPDCVIDKKYPADTECPDNLAALLVNLGKVYYDLADYESARCFYDRAVPFVKYEPFRAALSNNLGTIEYALKNYPAALAHFEDAMKRYADIAAAETLTNIALIRSRQQGGLAFASMEEALRLGRALGNSNLEAATLNSQAEVYIASARPKDALESLDRAILLFRTAKDRSGEATALSNAMVAWRMLGDRKTAIANGKLAIERFQELRIEARGVSGEIERTYLRTVRNAYQNLAELLIEEGLPEQAIEVLSLYQDAQSFARNRDSKVDISKLIQAQQALTTVPAFRAVTLYTLVANSKLYILPVTRDGINVFSREIAAPVLQEKVEKFLDVVRCADRDPYPAASELYDLIFKSTSLADKRTTLESFLQNENAGALLWSLDPPLHSVPMTALYNATTKEFLIEKYQLAVFTRNNPELFSREPQTWRSGIGFATSRQFTGKDPIPGAEASVAAIFGDKTTRRAGLLQGKTIVNQRFTADALNSLNGRWPLVHIVSHFVFEPGDAQDSFLVLGNGNKYTIAMMRERPALFAGVELLAIPVCESAAQHPDRYGKEIEAFADLAQHVGAKSVIASLWKVSYHVTPKLMLQFYKLARAHPDWPKSELLRQAQLSLLRGEILIAPQRGISRGSCGLNAAPQARFLLGRKTPFAHPYYWSAFVLYGGAR